MANSTPNDLNFQLPLIWNHYHKILSQIHKIALWINKKQKVVFLTLSWKNSCVCSQNPLTDFLINMRFWKPMFLNYSSFGLLISASLAELVQGLFRHSSGPLMTLINIKMEKDRDSVDENKIQVSLSQTRLSGRYQWGTHWQWKRDIYSKFVIFFLIFSMWIHWSQPFCLPAL